ncbi:uncharacterized protein LOC114270928 [Camellia sinensis]|uniref:uncharacterized protein LOC114270928 n=1 Tax=Camellia sinensis TaxID=4442 RepID=UPI001035D9FA|nr:uncharacterized protein LOC114270928 [Camellia sinensis]
MSAPRTLYYAALVRILQYLKGTIFHGLHYSARSSLQLRAFFDANWTGDPTDRHSTTGKKQSLTARSSTEAKYRALADTTQELLWLLADMGVTPSGATDLFL